MKHYLSAVVTSIAMCTVAASPAFAVDFEYFKSQSCPDLNKELVALQDAEKAVNEKIKKAENKANTQAVVSAILLGWPFWGPTDHGDSNAMLAEIRTDIKYITRAQKANKCT